MTTATRYCNLTGRFYTKNTYLDGKIMIQKDTQEPETCCYLVDRRDSIKGRV